MRSRQITKYGLLTVLLLQWHLCLAQQTPSLEQLLKTPLTNVPKQIEVSTASRQAQANSQSASITYVITSSDIEQFQWQSLAQIIQSLPGIYIGTDGAFQYVGVRGLGQPGDFNSRLLFLLDGVRINENIYDAGLLGTDAIVDVENIDRVEFAAGPGAAVYGNNAFFGVVNILTKSAQQLRGGALKLTVQTDGANKYFFNTAQRLEQGSEWWFTASHQQHPEVHLALPAPPGFEQAFEPLNAEHLSRLRVGARHQGLRVQALWSSQNRSTPTLVPAPAGWLTAPVEDKNDNALLSMAYQQMLGDNLSVSGHLNYHSSHYRRDIPISHPVLAITSLQSEQQGRWYTGDVLAQYQGLSDHDLLFGVEFQDDVRQQIEVRMIGDPQLLQGYYGHNQRKSVFVQDQWHLNSKHSLLLGARYDESRVSGHQLSPRLGWVWQLSDTEQLKLLYGSAYRAANLYEFATNAAFNIAVPADEEIDSAELSYEQRLSAQLSYRLSWFDAQMRRLISMAPDSAVFGNTRRVHNYGANIDLDWRLASGKMLSASWSWQHGHDPTGQALQNSPNHLVKLQYLQPVGWLDAQFSLQALAVSKRQVGDSVLPGYTWWQSGLIWQLHHDHQLILQLANLLDKAIYDRPLLMNPPTVQAGRVVSLSWRWQLW